MSSPVPHRSRRVRAGVAFARSAFLAAVVLLAGSAAAAPVITPILPAPDGFLALPHAVSANGTAVTGDGGGIAFRWTASGGSQSLGSMAGGTFSNATAISADGSVITGNADTTGRAFRAFRWTAAGGFQNLGTLPGMNSSIGSGISADGSVVVGSSTTRAFRWTAADGMQNLGTLPGAPSSSANATNADGSVVVGSSGTSGAGRSTRAFRWTAEGMEALVVPGDTTFSNASAVSRDGRTITGYAATAADNPTDTRAVRWTLDGGMEELGRLPGEDSSGGSAISGDGSTIVGASNIGNSSRAFLWTSSLGKVDLNTYLRARGLNLTGWNLRDATAISADGSAIAGYGDFNGEDRSFIVTGVPEPGSVTALLLGGMMAAGLRRRRR